MSQYIDVSFVNHSHDHSLEGAVHRWVARFEGMRFDVRGATAVIERSGRKETRVGLTIMLAGGACSTAASTHTDPFVAVSDAFRAVRRDLLAPSAAVTTVA